MTTLIPRTRVRCINTKSELCGKMGWVMEDVDGALAKRREFQAMVHVDKRGPMIFMEDDLEVV